MNSINSSSRSQNKSYQRSTHTRAKPHNSRQETEPKNFPQPFISHVESKERKKLFHNISASEKDIASVSPVTEGEGKNFPLFVVVCSMCASIINSKESHLHNIKIGSKRAIVTHTHTTMTMTKSMENSNKERRKVLRHFFFHALPQSKMPWERLFDFFFFASLCARATFRFIFKWKATKFCWDVRKRYFAVCQQNFLSFYSLSLSLSCERTQTTFFFANSLKKFLRV